MTVETNECIVETSENRRSRRQDGTMIYLHGSPNRMEVGDIILPGDEVWFCSSGGKKKAKILKVL